MSAGTCDCGRATQPKRRRSEGFWRRCPACIGEDARKSAKWAKCVNCETRLYPRPVRVTDEGLVHVACPPANARALAAYLEDLAWLAETGVGLAEAAARCGWASRESLDKWLRRHDAALNRALQANESVAA